MKKLNFAILGSGEMAKTMAKTVSMMPELFVLYAVASREARKAERISAKYGIQKAYDSYEKMLQDPEVDVVYVASANAFHYEHIKLCLNYAKHVLCEKPFTLNEKDAAELFEIAEERNVFVGEAMWTFFLPYTMHLKKLLEEGAIGDVSFIQASFGSTLTRATKLPKVDIVGGALFDLGVYPIAFILKLFGNDIANIQSSSVLAKPAKDSKSCTVVTYRDGKIAILSCDFTTNLSNTAVIYGSKGFIEIPNFWGAEKFIIYNNAGKQVEECNDPFKINGYAYEIEALYESIRDGKNEYTLWTHEDTKAVLNICGRIHEAWKKNMTEEIYDKIVTG